MWFFKYGYSQTSGNENPIGGYLNSKPQTNYMFNLARQKWTPPIGGHLNGHPVMVQATNKHYV